MTERDRDSVVLVVDDEPGLADLYTVWLKTETEYTVRTAYGGEEALERVDETVDVVVTDRHMPPLSGDDLVQRLAERGLTCRTAMVTAVSPDFDIVGMDVDDYLTKPISQCELLDVVGELLRRARHDPVTAELHSLRAKQSALQTAKSAGELRENDAYCELVERIETLDQSRPISDARRRA
ncbi:DNA-binding protein [Salinigranum rubrum]|uniref:DNA-binding protein n=1 Tax=Salinigranum rubrum TaxID=755307 RepID=A0A2I8VIC9_9EURY|nr:response regulator [Salinigranum rubrum]AUV81686.1 DNA-binding protein [Salinigranum rubrum]